MYIDMEVMPDESVAVVCIDTVPAAGDGHVKVMVGTVLSTMIEADAELIIPIEVSVQVTVRV